MKVLHIVQSIAHTNGGIARAVQGLVGALGRAGVEVALVSCEAGERPSQESISRFYAPRDKGIGLRRFLSETISDFRPDLIHTHGAWLPSIHFATTIARRKGIPYVMSPRGALQSTSLKVSSFKKKLALALYQKRDFHLASALHATAASEADQFRKLGFLNPIIVSPNGVNLPTQGLSKIATASAMPRNDEVASARHCERSEAIYTRTALFVGRMTLTKGVLELIEAWAQLKPNGWQCELVYTTASASERAYEAKVKARVAALGMEEQFRFTGSLSDDAKWDAYRRADFFVLPTYSENFGIVIAEALYAGLPVITTKGAPWAELEERDCGKWIDVGVKPLAEALREMMAKSDAERAAMGARGCLLVMERYLWEGIAKTMREKYEELVRRSRRD